jgi:uncharacterized protein YpuA (DUF1002 family)
MENNYIQNLYVPSLDEFNYLCSVNWYEKKDNKTNSVLCYDIYDILYPNFDNIINIDTKKLPIVIKFDEKEKDVMFNDLKNKAKSISNNVYTQDDAIKNGEHVYNFVFSNLTKELLNKNVFFKPKKSDYEEVKEKLSQINKKIVTINGRALGGSRDFGRNNNFKKLIIRLISEGFYVINCTIPKPELSINSENYLELDSQEISSYSRNIAYFLNSDCLISVSNAGGINNHLSTQSNIILFGDGGWVDNKDFGYMGDSLYSASQKFKPTFKTVDYDEIVEIIKTLERPKNILFFDETKIKSLYEG